jgi:uncharacterized protein DUF6580
MSDANGAAANKTAEQTTKQTYEGRLAVGLTIIGAAARLIPHPANFSPVGSMSLFAGAKLRRWQAYTIPLVLMAVTDPLLSRTVGFSAYNMATPFIYASFLINVWIGRRFLQGPGNPARIALAAILGSLQFFLITNAAWFQISGTYSHTWAGLLASYVAGLPFLGWTLAGDLAYTGLLFGLHAWLSHLAPFAGRKLQPVGHSTAL